MFVRFLIGFSMAMILLASAAVVGVAIGHAIFLIIGAGVAPSLLSLAAILCFGCIGGYAAIISRKETA